MKKFTKDMIKEYFAKLREEYEKENANANDN